MRFDLKAYFHNLNTTKYSLIQISSHLGVRVEPVRVEVLFQIQSINEGNSNRLKQDINPV